MIASDMRFWPAVKLGESLRWRQNRAVLLSQDLNVTLGGNRCCDSAEGRASSWSDPGNWTTSTFLIIISFPLEPMVQSEDRR